MNGLRRLIRDLVEKRLWPVAIVLVVAAVAVPLLIGGGSDGGSDAPASVLPPAPVAAASATSPVQLVGPPAVRSRPGPVHDPFRRSKPAATGSSGASKATPSSSSSKATSSTGDAGSGGSTSGGSKSKAKLKAKAKAKSGSGSSTAKPSQPAAPKLTVDPAAVIAARSTFQTVVRFTRAAGVTGEYPLYRLGVLGNPENPAAQYLGAAAGGEYAIFVLAPKATAVGDDGACVVADPCRVIGLRRGDKLAIDVAGEGLEVRHYVLEVARLRRLHMKTAKAARAWRLRVAPNGREALRAFGGDAQTAAALSHVRYAAGSGTITLTGAP